MRFCEDYLGRVQTDAIKGIFILLVFFSHFMGYVRQAGGYALNMPLGQMIVTCFLFYSGYGVMEAIKRQGNDYVKSIPKRRILTTLLNFDIAVLVFIAVDLLLGRALSWKQCLLSLVCWDSVGNSNWYIFAILLCYAATLTVRKEGGGKRCLCMLIPCVVALSFVKGSWWYDTMLCYPAGMIYAEYKAKIEALMRNERLYLIVLGGLAVIYAILQKRHHVVFGLFPNLTAISFALSVVVLTMRVPLRHKALVWCGKNLFPLYIYQRIPMLILFTLDPAGFASWRMPVYFFACFLVTVGIAKVYPFWRVRLNG